MKDTHEYLDPAAVAELGRLELVARTLVEGFLKGLHFSPSKGASVEFAEYRPYAQGDEVKRIDWRTYARTDRFFLKEYEDETNVRATLVLDTSGSMDFASGKITKLRYASCLLAAVGYLLIKQRDAVGLALVDEALRDVTPPKATAQHLGGVLRQIERASVGGQTELATAFHQLAGRMHRRGFAVIASDLLDEPRAILRSLSHLRHRGCEVLVFHIMDPHEASFPFTNWTVFRDSEAAAIHQRLDARRVREAYLTNLARHLDTLRQGCIAAGVEYCLMDTATPFEVALAKYLDARARVRNV